jgi:hypothetical protein
MGTKEMSKPSKFCNVCQSEIENNKGRIRERILALSMGLEERKALHSDYINMLREESGGGEEGQKGGDNNGERSGHHLKSRILEEESEEK